jgi:DNA polymerase
MTTSWDKLTLSIDIETYSSVDLRKSGVYRYTESPDFKVLMIAFAYGAADVQIVDDAPFDLINALTNPAIIKTAYNANFERVCLSKWLGIELPADQWRCTMVHALELGLPGSLDEVAKALGVDQQKDAQGKRLIKKYCMPNRFGQQTLPTDDLIDTDWQAFKEYCIQDVRTEMAVRKKLETFPLHDSEWTLWSIDQAINDRGIEIDPVLVANAVNMNDLYSS